MFGPFKKKQAEVLEHWYVLVPDYNASSQEFYAEVEKELHTRQVPGLEMTRVDFSEGGLLSDKRTYLRMLRERLVFDICAAPFGTSYFFSMRFAEIPIRVTLVQVAALFLALLIGFGLSIRYIGFFLGPLFLCFLVAFVVWVLRNLTTLGLQDLDTALLRSPLVGGVYERFFRKETYYRQDTRLMYHDTVSELVRAKVEEVTGAKGIKLLRMKVHSPLMEDLYKPRDIHLSERPDLLAGREP